MKNAATWYEVGDAVQEAFASASGVVVAVEGPKSDQVLTVRLNDGRQRRSSACGYRHLTAMPHRAIEAERVVRVKAEERSIPPISTSAFSGAVAVNLGERVYSKAATEPLADNERYLAALDNQRILVAG